MRDFSFFTMSSVFCIMMILVQEQTLAGGPRLVDTSMPSAPDHDFADSQRDSYDRAGDKFMNSGRPGPNRDSGHGRGGRYSLTDKENAIAEMARSNAKSCERALIGVGTSSLAVAGTVLVCYKQIRKGKYAECALILPSVVESAVEKAEEAVEACIDKGVGSAKSTSQTKSGVSPSALRVMRDASRHSRVRW
jgi:hypothetical protein